MKRGESGRGTIKVVRARDGRIIGYQPLLPRHLSTAPNHCRRPDRYREPLGSPLPTREEARALLDAAIVELRTRSFDVALGLPLSGYVRRAIDARRVEEQRRWKNATRAEKATSTWRGVDANWLSQAPFYGDPPQAIETRDLQRWFDWLRDYGVGKSGEPLSPSFMRHVAGLLSAAFERAEIQPNPMIGVKLPSKNRPRVEYLDIESQRRFFACQEVPLEDRIMVGCGLGTGLRVGELLSMEIRDVHVDSADPYLTVRYGGPHHAPTKSRKERRVELFEPGLGFWRLWLERYYKEAERVFEGERGGYRKAWPELFPGWAEHAGVRSMTSHVMRHTYAVAMLSGTWGYEPVGLEFVCKQLGHTSQQTTERYYGAFEAGTWTREVRRFTGRAGSREARERVTAAELLGLCSLVPHGGNSSGQTGLWELPPSSTQSSVFTDRNPEADPGSLQDLARDLAATILRQIADGSEGWARVTRMATDYLERDAELTSGQQEADSA